MEEKAKQTGRSPLRAIRAKCLDCCCGSSHEVTLCPCTDCPLYGYRDGHDPKRKGLGNIAHLRGAEKMETPEGI